MMMTGNRGMLGSVVLMEIAVVAMILCPNRYANYYYCYDFHDCDYLQHCWPNYWLNWQSAQRKECGSIFCFVLYFLVISIIYPANDEAKNFVNYCILIKKNIYKILTNRFACLLPRGSSSNVLLNNRMLNSSSFISPQGSKFSRKLCKVI